MIEVLVAASILATIALGAGSMFVTFGRHLTQYRLEQSLRSDIHSLFDSFSVASSCQAQLAESGLGFPLLLNASHIPLTRLKHNGQTIVPGLANEGRFPGQPRLRLVGAMLEFHPIAIAKRMVAATLKLDYQIDPENLSNAVSVLRHAERQIFFELTPALTIKACFDSISYHQLEWSERICQRQMGQLMPDGSCSLKNSAAVRSATCSALGLKYSSGFSGGLCEI